MHLVDICSSLSKDHLATSSFRPPKAPHRVSSRAVLDLEWPVPPGEDQEEHGALQLDRSSHLTRHLLRALSVQPEVVYLHPSAAERSRCRPPELTYVL